MKFLFEYVGYGSANILFEINGQKFHFNPTYIGENPLEALLIIIADFENNICANKDENFAYIDMLGEPESYQWKLTKVQEKDELQIEIDNIDGERILDTKCQFSEFRAVVCEESIRVLKKYGIVGFCNSWNIDSSCCFPLHTLLMLCGNIQLHDKELNTFSNLKEELKFLMKLV